MRYPSRPELLRLPPGHVIDVPEEIRLDPGHPEELLEAVRFLRDCAACGTSVRWTGRCSDPSVANALTHVPPPLAPLGAELGEQFGGWRTAYKQGVYFLRKGPGFRIVHDRRSLHRKPLRMVITDERLVDALEAGQAVIDIERSPLPAAVRHLAEAGLIMAAGGYAVTLPYRLPAWPIPAYSV
ncbi:DUF5825 family protein [Nonomuraea spiralis]|uniref:DUF5825 family protein n=1 Tax=Nonomuraea spiralis TaxID=46182 RepID=A0ABV5IY95_9ACTN|nr:DUF5825 family protein [Nonomuraea spiralis]GGT45178.1 hypothetical protein GCM10010176_105610 [Nonomuraea spiralis]